MTNDNQNTRNIVKYRNRLNDIPLRKFKPSEMDLFFAIAAQVRDKGVDQITLSFDQVVQMTNYKRSEERLISDLESTYDKLIQLNAKTDDGDTITRFTLFDMYQISRSKKTVTIAVNSRFKGLFNDLDRWTVFGLEQFVGLRSTYSKTMYRLVKQFRTTGVRRFKINEFRYLLDIPRSYAPQHIMERVVSVINSELPLVIPGFRLIPIRRAQLKNPTGPVPKRGRGAAIIAFKATWTKEPAYARKDITAHVTEEPVYRRLKAEQVAPLDRPSANDIKDLYVQMLKSGRVMPNLEKELVKKGVDVAVLKQKFLQD